MLYDCVGIWIGIHADLKEALFVPIVPRSLWLAEDWKRLGCFFWGRYLLSLDDCLYLTKYFWITEEIIRKLGVGPRSWKVQREGLLKCRLPYMP